MVTTVTRVLRRRQDGPIILITRITLAMAMVTATKVMVTEMAETETATAMGMGMGMGMVTAAKAIPKQTVDKDLPCR
jgi:hypothetical protein